VAAFPVKDADQIMLVTDAGQLIRTPVAQIRLASRATKGVTIFNTGGQQKVVSVELISDADEEPEGEGEIAAAEGLPPA
jgi:DNA gyrase subunit A